MTKKVNPLWPSLKKSKEYQARYLAKYPERRKESSRRWRLKNKDWGQRQRLGLKLEMIAAYGGKCSCCGEWRQEFLSLEHTNRDGNIHRAQVGRGGHHVWWDLKRRGWPQDGYTVYCFNCNYSQTWGRICPHKLERFAEALLIA